MSEDNRKQQALLLWQRAQHHHMRGEIALAIRMYTRSIGILPTAEAHTFRGWGYSAQGRLEEAIAECKEAIAVDPSFGNPYNDIGSYLIRLSKLEEAVSWLERAKVAPRYEPRHFPYLNLGRLYAGLGQLRNATEQFEGALRFDPGNEFALRALEELQTALN